MAKTTYISVTDDGLIISVSPMVILDTAFYEFFYKPVTDTIYIQLTFESPLPVRSFGSPAGMLPYISIEPLQDSTNYQYQIRRIDKEGNFSNWKSGTFTT